eukprot:scaffold49152_cov46-Attheya_sp.AAC.1
MNRPPISTLDCVVDVVMNHYFLELRSHSLSLRERSGSGAIGYDDDGQNPNAGGAVPYNKVTTTIT